MGDIVMNLVYDCQVEYHLCCPRAIEALKQDTPGTALQRLVDGFTNQIYTHADSVAIKTDGNGQKQISCVTPSGGGAGDNRRLAADGRRLNSVTYQTVEISFEIKYEVTLPATDRLLRTMVHHFLPTVGGQMRVKAFQNEVVSAMLCVLPCASQNDLDSAGGNPSKVIAARVATVTLNLPA